MTSIRINEGGDYAGGLRVINESVEGTYGGDNPLIAQAFEDAKGEIAVTNGSDAEQPEGMLHPDESKILTPTEKLRYISSVIEDLGATVSGDIE